MVKIAELAASAIVTAPNIVAHSLGYDADGQLIPAWKSALPAYRAVLSILSAHTNEPWINDLIAEADGFIDEKAPASGEVGGFS